MKRFEKKETYITFNDLFYCTYEINNIESVRLRIGMVVEKTYDVSTGHYLGCRHLSYTDAVSLVDMLVADGDYKRFNA